MPAAVADETKLNAFLEKVVGDLSANYAGVMISLGRRLGLYDVLVSGGPLSATEVANRSGCAVRYVKEWLNSQVAGGYLEYHPESHTYELSPEQALVLARPESSVYFAPAWEVPGSMWIDQDKAIKAFRSGGGVTWGEHDSRLYEGVAAFYRSAYSGSLTSRWLPALDGVVEKLAAGASVADVGSGFGHSTVLMAKEFPNSRFWGFDNHAASIQAAREVAAESGVDDRVVFEVSDAADIPDLRYDLVCYFDCLHDLGDPVAALARARETLAPGGSVMAVEPFALDHLEDNRGPIRQLFYAASSTLCVAHSIAEGGLALGAQAGESRLREVFALAGFGQVESVYEDAFNMVLQARP